MRHSLLVIGCGSIGERHIRCFKATNRTEVAATDFNAALLSAIGEKYGVKLHTDWENALLDPSFDVVLIATPAHLHVAMAMKALAAGKNVLIEKPLSISLDNVKEAALLRDRKGLKVAVAYVYHTLPYLRGAKDCLEGGTLGVVRQAWVTSGQPFHLLRPAYANTYYKDHKTGGGAIQDALTHFANWIESVLGPSDSVICDGSRQMLEGVNVEDTVHATARHGDVLVSYALNQFQAPNESTIQFNASRGSLKIEFHNARWGIMRFGDSDWTWNDAKMSESANDSPYILQANEFLNYVENQDAQICTPEAAASTLRFNLAALAAIKSEARVVC